MSISGSGKRLFVVYSCTDPLEAPESELEQLSLAVANALLLSYAARRSVELALVLVPRRTLVRVLGARVRRLSPDRDSARGWLLSALRGAKGLGCSSMAYDDISDLVREIEGSYRTRLALSQEAGSELEEVVASELGCATGVAVFIPFRCKKSELPELHAWKRVKLVIDLPIWGAIAVVNMMLDEVMAACSQSTW